ncbi:MAG: SUMF1/EgtB/PvdO family nonheme iron enzyme [Treponema sp.]|jgi:hypothetical protein|nr:SUMF1/EgtB/PvdO family nonheme iron enzyme [Treponema sp.]
MREKQTKPDDQVKLKPLMGIRAGVYLSVLYSAILLVILFFLLVYPGLKNPGAVLSVKTEPTGAAIRINDTYKGISGSRIHVPKGTHTIEAVLPGFAAESVIIEVPGRVFGSLFFPLRINIEIILKSDDPAAAFALAAADYAAWSFGGEPTEIWQIPLSLSEGAYRIGPANDPAAAEILKAASRFTVTKAGLRDLLRAKILMDNNGLSPSPTSLVSSVSDILAFLNENPGSALWLYDLLPAESAALIKNSGWYKSAGQTVDNMQAFAGVSARQAEFSGLTFRNIPESQTGNNVTIKNFMISENPVPLALFETFLNENPEWKDGYTDYFTEEINITSPNVITGITYFTAEAFCRWLTKRLPAAMSEMEVRLPVETELEYAVNSGIIKMESFGREWGYWEWVSDPFAPNQFISASPWAVQAVGSPERTLLGKPPSEPALTRASLPARLSSPFVTFRLVIAEKSKEQILQ